MRYGDDFDLTTKWLSRRQRRTARAVARGASIVELCGAVAAHLRMDEAATRDLRLAAAVHDIGKVADISQVELLPSPTPLGGRIIAACDAALADPTGLRAVSAGDLDPAVVAALEAVLLADPGLASLPPEGWQRG